MGFYAIIIHINQKEKKRTCFRAQRIIHPVLHLNRQCVSRLDITSWSCVPIILIFIILIVVVFLLFIYSFMGKT